MVISWNFGYILIAITLRLESAVGITGLLMFVQSFPKCKQT